MYKTITFKYTVGNVHLNGTADVDVVEWDNMKEEEKFEFITTAAIEEVAEMVDVVEGSIREEESD